MWPKTKFDGSWQDSLLYVAPRALGVSFLTIVILCGCMWLIEKLWR
jgi:hypothetical protein